MSTNSYKDHSDARICSPKTLSGIFIIKLSSKSSSYTLDKNGDTHHIIIKQQSLKPEYD